MDFLLTARMSVSLLTWIIKRLTKAAAGPLPEPARDDLRRYQAERSDGCAPEQQALQTFRWSSGDGRMYLTDKAPCR